MAFSLPLLLPNPQIPFPASPPCVFFTCPSLARGGGAGEAKFVQIKMEKKGLVDMENSGKSLAIPCTSRGTLEKLYPVGIQVFIDAAASPVPSRSVHGAPGPSLQLLPPGFLHQQRREHLRRTLGEVHKIGKLLMLIKNLLRFKCLLFLPSKNLSLQPPHLKS